MPLPPALVPAATLPVADVLLALVAPLVLPAAAALPVPVIPRVPLAAERTFLAWIRTGLALMGFGFVVARFGLSELQADEILKLQLQRLTGLERQKIVDELAKSATGSANRIARLCLLADPPTIDRGEITDTGSINQRAVLTHRADTVEKLHSDGLRYILKPTA